MPVSSIPETIARPSAAERRVKDLEAAAAVRPSVGAGATANESALLARVSEMERRWALLADTFVQIDALEHR